MFLRLRRADVLRALALVLLIVVAWCFAQNRLTVRHWKVPLLFFSDGIQVFALEKDAAKGHFLPLLFKTNPQLGAPYPANWNDFPFSEDLLWFAGGVISKFMGLFAAGNFLTLVGHVLAGLSLLIVCRLLRYRWEWGFVGGLAYGLAPYAFWRGLGHLGLTYYWHIPLCLLVCGWCWSRGGLELSGRKFWFAIIVAILAGIQNLYYANPFLQFLVLAGLAQAVRRQPWRKIVAPLVVGAVTVCAVLLMNLDTILYQVTRGLNLEASARTYQAVELYALKPLDLFMPPPTHHLKAARQIAQDYQYHYNKKTLIPGEIFAPYLGLFGITGLLGLAVISIIRISRRPSQSIPIQAGQVLWLLLYSAVGGGNGLLGQLGFNYFRCTNRYSIYILTIVVLFAVKHLSRATRSWSRIKMTAIAPAVAIVILWDQLPKQVSGANISEMNTRISSDRFFAREMEKNLPEHAMIFQVPVMRFPESPPIYQMGDYEHFRPYLHTRELRYSYGDDKGRGTDNWQAQVEQLPASEMIQKLEEYGFSAIYVNRAGYSDRGNKLIDDCAAAGRGRAIQSPAQDLVCVFLNPAPNPVLPPRWPRFGRGWYPEERDNHTNWRWSSGNAELVWSNDTAYPQKLRLSFELGSVGSRTVEIWKDKTLLYRSPELASGKISHSLLLEIPPGNERLLFKTQPAIRVPNSQDTRLLGFALYDFRVERID